MADIEERYEQIARYYAARLRQAIEEGPPRTSAVLWQYCYELCLGAATDAGYVHQTGYLPEHVRNGRYLPGGGNSDG